MFDDVPGVPTSFYTDAADAIPLDVPAIAPGVPTLSITFDVALFDDTQTLLVDEPLAVSESNDEFAI